MTMRTDTLLNWLTYHLSLGTAVSACDLIREYETPTAVRQCGADYLVSMGKLSPEQGARLCRPDTAKAREIMAVCREFNWQILTPDHPCYPIQLLRLPDFPLVLFASGNLALGTKLSMNAIVGTRRAGDAGLNYAYRLAAFFSENGVATVSGCAVGIDSAAHEGALTGEGSTIGVLGNGFGYNYLPGQVFLRRRIREKGLLLTETLPFQGPQPYSFQRRNRLISGLAYSVTVVESGRKGGSLITADYARRQKKRLFVPPREAVTSVGCEALLQNGAAELRDAADAIYIFHNQAVKYPAAPLTEQTPPAPCLHPEALSLEAWARLNGVSPAEAADVYGMLQKQHGSAPQQPEEAPVPPPQDLFYLAAEKAKHAEQPERTPVAAVKPPEKTPVAAPPQPENEKPPEKATAVAERNATEKTAGRKNPAATETEKEPPAIKPTPPGLSEAERLVYEALSDEPALLDEIFQTLDLPERKLMTAVSLLELKNLVRTLPGNLAARV